MTTPRTDETSAVPREPPTRFVAFITRARLERFTMVYARIALGAAFLSAVASRFELWDGSLDLDHFPEFLEYAAQVNSFVPAVAIPFLAWTATLAELALGLALLALFEPTRAPSP
jgi:putative oxidoreductase